MADAYLLDQGTVDHYQLEAGTDNYLLDTTDPVYDGNAFDSLGFVTSIPTPVGTVIKRSPARGLIMRGRR